MKKILLVLLLSFVIFGAIFHKQIIATIDFYQYQNEHESEFAKATITWDTIPFTSADNSGLASDSLAFDSLLLPIPYGATKKVGVDAAMAVGYTELITVTRSSAAENFFRMYNFSEQDEKSACAFLSQTSGRGACTSSYNFFRAFLELNRTDIHAFSPTSDKDLYNRLLLLRADAIPGNTVSAFETRSVSGFLFSIKEKEYVVELFDQHDQQYHLEFSGLKEADIAFILSNLSTKN